MSVHHINTTNLVNCIQMNIQLRIPTKEFQNVFPADGLPTATRWPVSISTMFLLSAHSSLDHRPRKQNLYKT